MRISIIFFCLIFIHHSVGATATYTDAVSQTPEYSGTVLTQLPNARYELVPANGWSAAQLLAKPTLLANSLRQQSLSFGYTREVLWLYFELEQYPEQTLFLQLGATFLDRVDLFYLDEQGQMRQQVTGDHIPFFERPVLGRSLVLKLTEVERPRFQGYLLRLQTASTLTLRPVLL